MAKAGAAHLREPLSGQKGRRAFAYWPPTLTAPHWPEKGTATHRANGSPPLTGHRLATYWPSGEAPHWPPTGQKGREGNFVRPSLTYGAPAPTGHLREPKTDLAKWRLWPPAPPRPTPADRGLRTGGPHPYRLATYWLRPALPHSPDFRGAVA